VDGLRGSLRWLATLAALSALALGGERGAEPELRPGREVRIDEDRVGGHFMLYVPSDYTAERRWPVIFCYHGQGGKPTTWPFRQVTGGRGFIVVGMGYPEGGGKRMTMAEFDRYTERKVQWIRTVAPYLERRLNVDKGQFFVGGFSMGGWSASSIGEAAPALWAGIAILGAGRHRMHLPMKSPRSIRSKPIYIGAGENDPNFPHAKNAAEFYRKLGAKVTFEKYQGLGHQMKTDTKALRDWLWANGPLRGLKARLAAARKAEKASRLGRAYTLYRELASISDTDGSCVAAGRAAKPIGQKAEKHLAEAQERIAGKRYAQALRLLRQLAATYGRSVFGERAEELVRKLQSDPKVQAARREAQLNAQADALEAGAAAAEKARDYARAIRLYEQYVAKFAEATRYRAVKAHLEALKADGAIRSAVRTQRASRECRVWLNLADNYLRAGKPAKAREYLARIITKYGDTDWAAKARERLAKLEEAGN